MIPAAGLATRFLPATKAVPKELLPVVDRPVLQYIVEECAAAGIHDVLLDHWAGQDQHGGSLRSDIHILSPGWRPKATWCGSRP